MANLSYENQQVLDLVQAMLGGVRPNLRAASIHCEAEGVVTLSFLLSEDTPEDREEIEDIGDEYCALQIVGLRSLKIDIVVSRAPFHELQFPGRMVFIRHETID